MRKCVLTSAQTYSIVFQWRGLHTGLTVGTSRAVPASRCGRVYSYRVVHLVLPTAAGLRAILSMGEIAIAVYILCSVRRVICSVYVKRRLQWWEITASAKAIAAITVERLTKCPAVNDGVCPPVLFWQWQHTSNQRGSELHGSFCNLSLSIFSLPQGCVDRAHIPSPQHCQEQDLVLSTRSTRSYRSCSVPGPWFKTGNSRLTFLKRTPTTTKTTTLHSIRPKSSWS